MNKLRLSRFSSSILSYICACLLSLFSAPLSPAEAEIEIVDSSGNFSVGASSAGLSCDRGEYTGPLPASASFEAVNCPGNDPLFGRSTGSFHAAADASRFEFSMDASASLTLDGAYRPEVLGIGAGGSNAITFYSTTPFEVTLRVNRNFNFTGGEPSTFFAANVNARMTTLPCGVVSCDGNLFQNVQTDSTMPFEQTLLLPPGSYFVQSGAGLGIAGRSSLDYSVTGSAQISFDLEPRPVKISFVDPNSEILERFLQIQGQKPKTFNPAELYTMLANGAGRPVTGMAADGVTPVIVMAEYPIAATAAAFYLHNEDGIWQPSDGQLMRLDNSRTADNGFVDAPVKKITIAGKERYFAFAVVVSPPDFVRTNVDLNQPHRSVYIKTAASTNGLVEEEFSIDRPPVTLVHGVWSNRNTFLCESGDDTCWDILSDDFFVVNVADYEHSHAKHFSCNIEEAGKAVSDALKKFRSERNAAATQVDYVGHSMGGILGRLYVGNFGAIYGRCGYRATLPYERDNNFFQGDVHKLITLASPHRGTQSAHLLVGSNGLESDLVGSIYSLYDLFPQGDQWKSFCSVPTFGTRNCLTDGAVADFRLDSWINRNMPAAPAPSHAILASGGDDLIAFVDGQLSQLDKHLKATRNPYAIFFGKLFKVLGKTGVAYSTFMSLEHDLVVPESSQEGLLQYPATTKFTFIPPPFNDLAIHTSVTKEKRVGDRVRELLHEKVGSAAFAGMFPAGNPLPSPPPDLMPQKIIPVKLKLNLPAGVTSVSPGAKVSIRVVPQSGFVPQSVTFIGPDAVEDALTAPYSFKLKVPPSALGEISVSAIAVGTGGKLARAEQLKIPVVTTARVNAIAVSTDQFELGTFRTRQQSKVTGVFSDGYERNITAGSLKTKYTVKDKKVAGVSKNGLVFAKKDGTTNLKVKNSGNTRLIPLTVEGCGTLDADLDEVMDNCDNCPGVRNPKQGDADEDYRGDACPL